MQVTYKQDWQGSKPAFWYRSDESQPLRRISTPEAITLWRDKKIEFTESVLNYFRSEKSQFNIDIQHIRYTKLTDSMQFKSHGYSSAKSCVDWYFQNLFYGLGQNRKDSLMQIEKVKKFLMEKDPLIEVHGDWMGFSVPPFEMRILIQNYALHG